MQPDDQNTDDQDTDDSDFGCYEAECQACDTFGPVDDIGLCLVCTQKLDRDMIRQRQWDYSVSAFGTPPDQRDALRARTIAEYGEALELVAENPSPPTTPRPTGGQQRRQRRHRRR